MSFRSEIEKVEAARKSLATYANLIGPNYVERTTSDKAAKAETQRENAARYATCEWTYISTGVGQKRITKPLFFGISFRNEPHFTCGSAMIKNPDPDTWNDPIGLAGVRTWERDSRGLYVGAHIWVRTDMYPVNPATTSLPPAKTSTMHYLTFTGNGIKEIVTPKTSKLKNRAVGLA